MDYQYAYGKLCTALLPRWGGNHQALYDLGVECLDTTRYDTEVPDQFFFSMKAVVEDAGDYRFWKRPGVYENIVRYCLGQAGDATNSVPALWWQSLQAACAWRCGKYDQARQIWEDLGDQFEPRVWAKLDGDEKISVSQIHAQTGKTKIHLDTADRQRQREEYGDALNSVVAALKITAPGDPALAYLNDYHRLLQWEEADPKGEWAELTGGKDLSGWKSFAGDWSVDRQGRLIGQSSVDGRILECKHDFGYRIEIRGEMTLVESPYPDYFNAGLMLAFHRHSGHHYHYDVLFYIPKGELMLSRHFHYDQTAFPINNAERTLRFHVRQWDQQVRVQMNDEAIVEAHAIDDDTPRLTHSFAIGGRSWYPGATVRIDRLEVRRQPIGNR